MAENTLAALFNGVRLRESHGLGYGGGHRLGAKVRKGEAGQVIEVVLPFSAYKIGIDSEVLELRPMGTVYVVYFQYLTTLTGMSGHNSGAGFIAKLLRHCGSQGLSLVHSKCAISTIVPSQIWTHHVSCHTQVYLIL